MTGRNHTTNGMATITEAASGFPSSNGHIPFECATIAEVLGERGWNTYMAGKWHLTAEDEMNLASRKTPVAARPRIRALLRLPRRRDQPVVSGPRLRQPPGRTAASRRRRATTSTIDLTDKALSFIRDAKAIAPDKPFFLYYCPGACHAPHHAPKEWADKYKGKFDMGYEAYRELVFERQKTAGRRHRPGRALADQPLRRREERGRQGLAGARHRPARGIRSRDDEKRLFCRMAEVYAGFLSHADHEIGRLLDHLEEIGRARQHDDRARLRQRRLRRGRPERLGEREQDLQRATRHDRGEPAVPRRARQPADLQPLPDRLGVRVQHAVQAVEALLELGGRHRRPDDRLLAERGSRTTGVRRQYAHAVDIVPDALRGARASSRPRW